MSSESESRGDETRDDLHLDAAQTAIIEAFERENDAGVLTTMGTAAAASPDRVLEAMQTVAQRSVDELFEPGTLIGEGGMGVVHSARQRSVGREVAVKSLRDPHRSREAAEASLLQEAWVTAAVEHPNVVPVHDVLLDGDKGPIIVLKRVLGTPWSTVIAEAGAVKSRFGAEDLLEFNLDVLMQLCRALHFAHTRGVVHRDVKPTNVMLGEFGEVYLLDWGIAVTIEPDPTGRLPHVADRAGLAGTLAYMAPEMLDPDVGTIGPRTDVYLLGAVLYEIVCGHPPHDKENKRAIALSILESRPQLSELVPEELTRIVARAMARDPLDRHASAEELRLDLQRFLRSRGSMRLVDEALARFGDLTWLLETREADDIPKERLFELFGQCRFGLQQALVGWEENERARRALRDLLDRMIRHLMSVGDPGAAGALLAEHPQPDPELARAVEVALDAERGRQEELERLRRDVDPRIGVGARRAAMVAMGIVWTFAPLLANVVEPASTPAVVGYASPLGLLALALGVWYAARDKLSSTAINRRFLIAMLVGFCAHMVHLLIVPLAGLEPKTELPMGMVSFGAIAAVLAYTAERRLWPLVPVYWGGALVAASRVQDAAFVLSGCNLVLTLYMLAIWAPRRGLEGEEEAPASKRLS